MQREMQWFAKITPIVHQANQTVSTKQSQGAALPLPVCIQSPNSPQLDLPVIKTQSQPSVVW
ncbi:hypothetical protein HRbin17_01221 [bacterium HR17]|uniref:Uncharacterized protein n=1 Tax=Candidatus Fervidibacter japonicus TaxID=2035412 RepID=A0A2H5XC71_9BACT|nr:hypothetical protein HRbin17_01221 [bacterium HR17]